jgi:hypothetical protein
LAFLPLDIQELSFRAQLRSATKKQRIMGRFASSPMVEHIQSTKLHYHCKGIAFFFYSLKKVLFDISNLFCKELGISSAEQVQIIADGAPWIWLRMKPLFHTSIHL